MNEEHDKQPEEHVPEHTLEPGSHAVPPGEPPASDIFTRELLDLVAMLESDEDTPAPPAAEPPVAPPATDEWSPPPAEARSEFLPHSLLDSIAQSMAALETRQLEDTADVSQEDLAALAEAWREDNEPPEEISEDQSPIPLPEDLEAASGDETVPELVQEDPEPLNEEPDGEQAGEAFEEPDDEPAGEIAGETVEEESAEGTDGESDGESVGNSSAGHTAEPPESDESPDADLPWPEVDAPAAPDMAETSGEDELEALISQVDRDTAEGMAEPGDSEGENDAIDRDMVDALLEEMARASRALPDEETEAPVVQGEDEEAPLNRAAMDDDVVSPATPEVAVAPAGGGPVNQVLIDSLLSQMNTGKPPEDSSSAGASAPDTPEEDGNLLSQAALDDLISQAREQERSGEAKDRRIAGLNAPPPITEEETAAISGPGEPRSRWARWRQRRAERGPGRWPIFLHANRARIVASLATGALAAIATFSTLYGNPEQTPTLAALEEAAQSRTLESAMRRARELMSANEHSRAAEVLRRPLADAFPSTLRVEAEYLEAEARYRALPASPPRAEAEAVLARIEQVLAGAPGHPRAPYAWQWKARLLESLDLLPSAQSAYASIIENYGGAPNLQTVLLDASRLALRRQKPETALSCARQLIQQFPDSAARPEAELLIGDAYAMSGMLDEARALYVGMAEQAAGQDTGGEALQRLGEMALARGQYEEAARLLNQRLETGTTTAGYDRVYLKLGQALRKAGRFEEARQYLNELINFFPLSGVIPQAYIELSQALDSLGERPEALRVAQQAATRFPQDPGVLLNAGELYGRAGRAQQAAILLEAADAAGANDPGALLAAGRFYRDAAQPLDALRVLERLRSQHPRAPQAIHGGIEAAMVLYGLGQAARAVDRLESIAATTVGTNQRLPALTGLARIYQDMGLTERVAETAHLIAGISAEPQVQADAAVSLLDAGAYEEGLRLAERVDLTALSDRAAYRLLHAQGAALARFDPRRALEKMEGAYLAYPRERTLEGDRDLLNAYLAAGQRAAARRIITEMEARVQENPVDSAHLVHAAVAWGGHLAGIGDHREAARAYAIALDTAQRAGKMDDAAEDAVLWAKYQRASALLQSAQYAESLPLLEEVAASGAPWANEAALKAEYARAEQRLRTPPGGFPGETG